MEAMDSMKDLDESLNNWLKAGMGGQEPSECLLQAFWTLSDLDMENGSKREVGGLRIAMIQLVKALLPADTPEVIMATVRRASAVVQEFSPKAAGQVEVVGLMLAFQLLRLTALQAVYRAMQNTGADRMAHLELI